MPGQLECAVRRSEGCRKVALFVCHHCGKPLCDFRGKGTTPKEMAATRCVVSYPDEQFPDGAAGDTIAHHCPDCEHADARRSGSSLAPSSVQASDRSRVARGGGGKWLVLAGLVIAAVAGTGWWLSRPDGAASKRPPPREDVIAALVGDWASAFRNRDLDRHVSYYAPRLDRYFGRRGVDRAAVGAEKRRLLDARFRRLDAYEVAINGMTWASSDEVTVRVQKRWDARRPNGTRDTGGASHQVVLRRSDGQWRIVAENE